MRSQLRSAARPIASLHGSLRLAKCFLTHNKMRPAVGLMAGHCSWIFVPQDSRTAAFLTIAAFQGSLKSWKLAFTISLCVPFTVLYMPTLTSHHCPPSVYPPTQHPLHM